MEQRGHDAGASGSGARRPPDPAAVAAFWSAARAAHPDLPERCAVRWIGIDAPTTRQILELIRRREKTGTFTLPWLVARGERPMPAVGDCLVLVDWDGTPALAVRLTGVREVAFGAISERETAVDGPPVRSLAVWKPLHRRHWTAMLAPHGLTVTDAMPVLVETFEPVYDPADAR